MSKHKHFHNAQSMRQILVHGRRERIGPFGLASCTKKTAPGAANTDGGRMDPAVGETNESTPIVGAGEGGCQDEN